MLLETKGLVKAYGSLRAVDDVSIQIEEGESRAIIGTNGAGKTTLLDLITQKITATEGEVWYDGKNITGRPVHYLANLGIGKCFQINQLFLNLTVFENVRIACISRAKKKYSMFSSASRCASQETADILAAVGLYDKRDEIVNSLSYADQRRLEVAVTLGIRPKLLLLDEPTAGIARQEGYALMDMIKNLAAERQMTVVFIEHDMDIVFNYANVISVMHMGKLIATGRPEKIKENEFVKNSYFGDEE